MLAEGWNNAILEGLAKNQKITRKEINFQSVYWADVMYDNPDPNPDLYKAAKPGALKRYKDSWQDYLWAQALDFGGDILDAAKKLVGLDAAADHVLEKKLQDLHKYYTDKAKRTELRDRLKKAIRKNSDKRIMLVSHSMGSIIAYDTLRELGREEPKLAITHFVTIGSPLGLPHVKYQIIKESSLVRAPSIVQSWTNLADRRDPVAFDVYLRDDYEPNAADVRVKDDLVMNDWGGIHHKSYGYLRTPEFTDIVRTFI
ncbi:hypothetical protein NB231_13966 [Nitrococcus mobilis Nb-231]|uniref:Uncharacterized protein n=1 Tax=Nitrococcus mobilis Nb-231 TaxID=314278 RepID=A4BV19_9GAMM|nr:hypothetical protein NB231_13966 [Nitrococcus mobilis Nb-231]